jgi:glycine C-acetyltransferase/8-amino-7-oxononanoate synthase
MDPLKWLAKQRQQGNLRSLRPLVRPVTGPPHHAGNHRPLIDCSSNDYLALSSHPQVIATSRQFLDEHGAGSGAARLMSGDLALHHQLEEAIARFKGQPAALLFGSGYMANTGVIPALIGRHDVIFSDKLNHASIVDGCQLSGARIVRFRHNDMEHLAHLLSEKRGDGQALIVVESLYSMDGDKAPLHELVQLKEKYTCLLLVDEAHATGIFGATGAGLVEEAGVTDQVDLVMGTFGKALGSYGAYVAASQIWIDFLLNRARSFIYSTSLPPAVIGASLGALQVVAENPGLGRKLLARAAFFKNALVAYNLEMESFTQIMPLVIGASEKAVELAAKLGEVGFFVTAVRPPTVPENTARLRFSVTLHQGEDDLASLAKHVASLI